MTLAAAALAALGLGIWAGSRTASKAAPDFANAVVLPSPRPIADFTLSDQDGRPWTREQLHGHWSLLFAGFTHCPDVCPATLGVMKAVEQRIGTLNPVQMIFLSVDPERDTPEAMKRYVRYFSPTLTGITGPTAQLDALSSSLGLAYMKAAGTSASEYSVDHSAALALINPQAQVAAYFQAPHQVEPLVADLTRIVGVAAACPGLEVQDAWIREAPPGADTTAGYARLRNTGAAPLQITGVASPAFADAGLHRTELANGSYSMAPAGVIDIPAGGSVTLAPNGLHLMLTGAAHALHSGGQVPVSFTCGQNKSEAMFDIRPGSPS
jgi:protein SCO1/2